MEAIQNVARKGSVLGGIGMPGSKSEAASVKKSC